MVILIGLQDRDINVFSHFIPDVTTYEVISDVVSEHSRPYRIAKLAMLWVEEDGSFRQIESISPKIVDHPLCSAIENIRVRNGYPLFEVTSCDNEAFIQPTHDGFVLWLTRDRKITEKICYKTIVFLLSDKELVGIEAHNVIIEE